MLGKVKNWLGIEGVKMEIETPERVKLRDGALKGSILFQSINNKKVTYVKLTLIEKYTRGRGKNKLINEYKVGEMEVKETFDILANSQLRMDFTLFFTPSESEMDILGHNFLLKGPVAVAKLLKGAKSLYRLEVEAKVPGTALNPFAKKEINFY